MKEEHVQTPMQTAAIHNTLNDWFLIFNSHLQGSLLGTFLERIIC